MAKIRQAMEDRTKKTLSRIALALGTVSTLGLVYALRKNRQPLTNKRESWARPGMALTFRAELMPGRDTEARTFRVRELLSQERVHLEGFTGEYTRDEVEPLRFE